jgi:putative hydrolase of the HAD superfamily|tara:strand:- start:5800 stop:6585 length:786 start_codon:yes stop_codon:yes gene_type:complete
MIKGVIFDLDDTLTTHEDLYNLNYLKTIYKFFPDLNIPKDKILEIIIGIVDKIGTKKYFNNYYHNVKFGGRDLLWGDCGGYGNIPQYTKNIQLDLRYEIWNEIIDNLSVKTEVKTSKIISYYIEIMWRGIKVFDDVIETLNYLRNYKLAVLTNGMPIHQRRKITSSGLRNFFTGKNRSIITSAECGFGKPNSIPYELTLQRLNLSRNEVIMVGDRPEGDIFGANLLGIKTVYINRNSETIKDIAFKPDIEINSLNQLIKII